MPAKPALSVWSAALLLGVCAGPLWAQGAALPAKSSPLTAKAPLPTVLLYPATPGDVAALVDLRTRLRLDGRVAVLTYDPESAAIQRAASEASHPEWLGSAPASDSGRMTLARALGARFYAVVSPGRLADTTHVELVETAPAARTFGWTGTNRQFGVRALESQVADSLSHPVNSGTEPSAVPLPAPIAPLPGLAPTAVAAAPPTPALPTPALPTPAPEPLPPLDLTPLPVAKSAAAPLDLPVPAASVPPVQIVPALPPTQVASAPPPPITPPPLPSPVPAAVPEAPAAEPQIAAGPLPKRVAAVPKSTIDTAVPEPRFTPEPPAAPTMPRPPATPIAAVPIIIAPIAQTPVYAVKPPTNVIKPPVQIAKLPPPALPQPILPLPMPAPALVVPAPVPDAAPAPTAVKKRPAQAEDIAAVTPLLARGDSALDSGDAVSAISFYRQAINGAPLAVVPRLKLASAYQKDGLGDRALDEARRALEIAPDDLSVQKFLTELDLQTGTAAGTLVRSRAALALRPADPKAHADLGDALWNNGDLSGAEAEYKAASALAPGGSRVADTQLAQLYAAEARYGDCLAILRTGGKQSYGVAIQIVKSRAETLGSTLAVSRETFSAGKSTREQFYDDAKKLSAEAQALAGFVADVVPPAAYKLSHLHRTLSTNLLAQEAATLVTYIETSDSRRDDRISRLEHAAATEMLTAQATEERLGLWTRK